MDKGLVLLAARRSLSPALLALFLLLALALVRRGWTGEAARLDAADPAALERAFARSGTWLALLLVVLPATIARAAGVPGRWRRAEADWLAPRALPRRGAVLSTWLGTVAGGATLLALAFAAAELAAGGAPPAFASGGVLEARDVERFEGGERVRWVLADPEAPPGSRLAFDLSLRLDTGPTGELVLRARRAAPQGEWVELRRRLAAPARVEIPVPAGVGPVELELVHEGGALLFLAPRAELWLPARSEALGSLALLLHAGLALAALAALAMGLSAWTRPATAAALLASVALALLLSGAGASTLAPGSALPAVLATVEAGRVPPAPGAAAVLGAALLTVLGLALTCSGHSPWRRGA